MLLAGMKSLSALREYSVSPRVGSTIRMPQCALRKSGTSINESTKCCTGFPIAVVGRDGAGVVTTRGAVEQAPTRSRVERRAMRMPERWAASRSASRQLAAERDELLE